MADQESSQSIPAQRSASNTPPARRSGSMGGKLIGGGLLLAIAAGIIYGAVTYFGGQGNKAEFEESTHKVKQETFLVTVIEDGNMESAKNVDVKCQVAGGSSILWIVDDGSYVEKGEKIVELESSQLDDQINQQKNVLEKARAAKIQAEKDHSVAKISVNEYIEGTFLQQLQDADTIITIAEENLRSAQNALEHSQKMFRKGYLSKLELESQNFNVRRAELELASAKTTKNVLTNFTKAKTLEDLSSAVETTKAKMDSEVASFALEQSRLDRLEAQLANCLINAPQSGMVVYANETSGRFGSSQGPQIEEGAAVREQQTIVRLPDLSQMQVKVNVHESKVEQIRIGQRANISVLGKKYTGEVVNVANQPEPSSFFSAGTKEYATIVKVEGNQEGLKPGMTAQVEILINEVVNVLTVPVAAVVEKNGKLLTWVKSGNGYEKRVLKVGWSNEEFVEVSNGVELGEIVVKNPRRFADLESTTNGKEEGDDESAKSKFGDTSKAPKLDSDSANSSRGGDESGAKSGDSKGDESSKGRSGGSGRPSLMDNDKDGDGKVSKEEAPERMRDFFDRMDTNGDGFIDKAEYDALRSGGGRPGGGGPGGGGPGGGGPGDGDKGGGRPDGGANGNPGAR